MIPRSHATLQAFTEKLSQSGWKKHLSQAISSPHELLELLELDSQGLEKEFALDTPFPLKVPHSYVARMEKGNPNDPLLLQVLPLKKELLEKEAYTVDPVGDLISMSTPGVLKKYHGRALLVTTGACGIHCRYCFRRHFPYSDANPANEQWSSTINDLMHDPSINEVILSGGDPLCLSDERLSVLTKMLDTIPHLKRLRIHSRLPVVLPERIDSSFLSWLKTIKLKKIMVLHINHPNEINQPVKQAMHQLAKIDTVLFNQAVLLRGVNDNSKTLINLSETLFAAGITPYYLHMLDKVQGASHFDVSDKKARELMDELRKQLPGYLVPRLVREQINKEYKVPM